MLVLEDIMGNRRSLVVTAYGHSKTIDKIAVSSFEISEGNYYSNHESDAKTYCDTINSLELKGDSWVSAKILSENTQYSLDIFFSLKFSDIITKLDNMAIQKILREIDFQELAKSLKDQDEIVKEKIFTNMSKRASLMLKENMEFMGPTRITDVKESQKKIVSIILHLDQTGEIIIPNYKGETTA
jgi:flagellar motor switch protein FliG